MTNKKKKKNPPWRKCIFVTSAANAQKVFSKLLPVIRRFYILILLKKASSRPWFLGWSALHYTPVSQTFTVTLRGRHSDLWILGHHIRAITCGPYVMAQSSLP